ncbi:hypothetical protein BURK2_02705 [Burkholderiales bacterium]|nr:hypothetical protein BURK2_02705 [Burkholderiales bacterium]
MPRFLRTKRATILGLIALGFAATSGAAPTYRPGEMVEFRSSGYPEKWEEVTFIGTTPGGSQPIIRQKPNAFSKEGNQRAASWDEIRPLGSKPAAAPAPGGNRAVRPVAGASANAPRLATPEPSARASGGPVGRGDTGLMNQAEILHFLKSRLGEQPFQNPRREAIKLELAELIKARGLDFVYDATPSAFYNELSRLGANTSELGFPLRENYGPPTRQTWLMGSWQLGKVAPAVYVQKGEWIYRKGDIGVSGLGTLNLDASGTYLWKSATAQSTQGRWRAASKAEMKAQGGEGVVLLKAKSGYDWIVTQDRTTTLKGDWIRVSELGTRQVNEYGQR